MIKTIQLLIVLLYANAFAQIKGTIQNSTTKEPIPYVNIWVEGDDNGTSANENGQYILADANAAKTVLFSAVGYGDTRIKVSDLKEVVYLEIKAIALNELVIAQKKNIKKRIVNPMDAIDETYFSSSSASRSPKMVARFIPYKKLYAETPFISSISFLTNSDVRNAIFYVRLYTVNNDGDPGELLHEEPITGTAVSKKKDITTVDVSKLNIQIPETGFFVAIEWLIITRNEYRQYTAGSGKKGEIYYTPKFKNVYTKYDVGNWVYQREKWKHEKKQKHNNKFFTIAAEIILTD